MERKEEKKLITITGSSRGENRVYAMIFLLAVLHIITYKIPDATKTILLSQLHFQLCQRLKILQSTKEQHIQKPPPQIGCKSVFLKKISVKRKQKKINFIFPSWKDEEQTLSPFAWDVTVLQCPTVRFSPLSVSGFCWLSEAFRTESSDLLLEEKIYRKYCHSFICS